jgi:hypothetical protein
MAQVSCVEAIALNVSRCAFVVLTQDGIIVREDSNHVVTSVAKRE